MRPSSWTLSALCPRTRVPPSRGRGNGTPPGGEESSGAHLSEPAAWDFPTYTYFGTDSAPCCMVRLLSACLI